MNIKKTLSKAVILFILLFSMTTQSADAQAPKVIKSKIRNISTSILHKDWDKASKLTIDFRKFYDKNRWKYQLLGDEQEYESISNDIENLKAAIIAKDKTQALIFTSDIREIFDQIYQL